MTIIEWPLCRLRRLVAILLALALSHSALGAELEEAPFWVVEPGEQIYVQGDEASGSLRLQFPKNGPRRLLLKATLLKMQGEEEHAWIGFEPGGRTSLEIDLEKNETQASIPYTVKDINRPGLYQGQLFAQTPDGTTSSPVTLTFYRAPLSAFEPKLTGSGVGEDGSVNLQLTGTSPEVVQLAVDQPPSAVPRRLQFAFVSAIPIAEPAAADPESEALPKEPPEPTVSAITFEPNPLDEHHDLIKMTVPGVPSTGLDGFIKITDAANGDVVRYIAAKILPAPPRFAQWTLILFVGIGAVLSVLLNTALPASISKRRKHDAIMKIRHDIQQCTTPGSWLQLALNVEQNRIRKINSDIQWYSSSKKERFDELDELIKTLRERAELAVSISNLRKSLTRLQRAPGQLRRELGWRLDDAERAILDEQLELARQHLNIAETLRSEENRKRSLDDLRSSLPEDNNRLLESRPTNGAGQIDELVAPLFEPLRSMVITNEPPEEELLDRERDYDRAELYQKFERKVLERYPNMPGLAEQRERFVELLKAADFDQAIELMQVLERGMTPQTVYNALGKAEPEIAIHPRSPEERQSATYTARFRARPELDADPIRRLMFFEWTFDDSTATSTGPRCVHHFPLTRWWRTPSLWCRRQFAGHYDQGVTVRVVMADPSGERAPNERRKTEIVPVRGSTARGFGLSALEAVTFVLSTAIAVLAAYGAEQADLVSNATWSAAITAALFGFGLDQIRDRSLNPSTA